MKDHKVLEYTSLETNLTVPPGICQNNGHLISSNLLLGLFINEFRKHFTSGGLSNRRRGKNQQNISLSKRNAPTNHIYRFFTMTLYEETLICMKRNNTTLSKYITYPFIWLNGTLATMPAENVKSNHFIFLPSSKKKKKN